VARNQATPITSSPGDTSTSSLIPEAQATQRENTPSTACRNMRTGTTWLNGSRHSPGATGNVGMLGMSYFGTIQFLIAAQNPPHLKAIFPYEAHTDRYRHQFYHGGIMNMFYIQWWGHVAVGMGLPRSLREKPEEMKKLVKDLMNKDEVQIYVPLYDALKYPEKNPPLFEGLTHPLDGPYYWEVSPCTKFDRIKIPCYMACRWSGWPIHLPGAFSAFNGIDAPKKIANQ